MRRVPGPVLRINAFLLFVFRGYDIRTKTKERLFDLD
jgi:hypothetical protein